MSKKKTEKRFRTLKKDRDSMEQASFPKEGEVISRRFKLIKKIGEGSFSVTFKAYDSVSDRERTLKIFGRYPEVFHSLPDIREESNLLKKIEHKSLPKYFDLHELDYIFIELEYIEAQNLDQKISKVLNKKEKFEYANQLAKCLFFLHYRKIEHNDLKPENILITPDQKLYLIDFGTAALQKNQSQFKEFEGTLEYCPPESKQRKEVPFQRDIFAYGIILYQIYYGKYPFETNLDGDIDYKTPSHLLTSKKKIDQIIKNCLQYYPEDRYRSFQDIIEELEEPVENEKTIYKTITQSVVKKNLFDNMSEDFKKDLKYLWLNMICLLLLLPFFLYVKDQESHIERMVDIDSPPFSIFVNGQYIGIPPNRALIKKGDLVTFIGHSDLTNFEFTVGKEKSIRIDAKGNRIFLNHRLKGIILTTNERIPQKVEFIGVRGDISGERLKKLKRRNLHIAFTPNIPELLLNSLPDNIKSLSLRNFSDDFDLSVLDRFRQLRSLDLTGVTIRDLQQMPPLVRLQMLNLQKTSTTDISPLNRLSSLRHLNLESNNVADLHPLRNNRLLETLNINNNSRINDIFSLYNHANLRQIINNNSVPQSQIDSMNSFLDGKNQESSRKQRIIIEKKDNLQLVINILIIVVLSAIMVQIFKLIFKYGAQPLSKNKKEIEPEREPEPTISPKKLLDLNLLRPVDMAISEKRYYTPEKESAILLLSSLIAEYPDDSSLQLKKVELMDLLEGKIKDHLSKNELEPVYMCTLAIDKYFPDKQNTKIFDRVKKKFNKNEEVKWIFVKDGSFQMGDFMKGTSLLHDVRLSSFKMSETPVTNKQYVDFLNSEGNQTERGQTWAKVDTQYSRISRDRGLYYVIEPYGSFPVYEVSWYGAQRYSEWLGGRLPTEAEWEYAARSCGERVLYATGNKLEKDVANFTVDPNDHLWHSVFPVKSFAPNKIGLYEMSGNILEWCYDWFDINYYANSSKTNPIGPNSGTMKVVRGGAWCFQKDQAVTFYRTASKPTSRNNYIGFRVVMPV